MNTSILQRAKELWQSAIALTDFNGVYGVVDFYSKAKWFEIQPLIGVELPYISHRSLLGQDKNILQKSWTLTFLALTELGYHNLLRLVSAAYNNAHYDIPCLDNEILSQYPEDICVLVGGIESYAYQSLAISNDSDRVVTHIDALQQIYWIEHVIIDITSQSFEYYPILQDLHTILLEQAEKNSLLIVTSSWFTYPYKDQKIAYETALAIKDNKRTYDPDSRKVKWEYHILSEEEVRKILQKNWYESSQIDLWISNTLKVAEMSHVKILLGQALFPNYEVPEDIQKLYEQYREKLIQE